MSTENQEADYSQMTAEDFDEHLHLLLERQTAATLLDIGDVYTIVAEEFNNEVLDSWAAANPDKAYPNREDNDE